MKTIKSIPSQETDDSFVIYLDNEMQSIRKDHEGYAAFKKAWESEDVTAIRNAIKPRQRLQSAFFGKLQILGDNVFYDGVEIKNPVVDRIMGVLNEGGTEEDIKSLSLFLINVINNPSPASRESLFSFLEHKELKITDDGHFIAFKGVQKDYWSAQGNVAIKPIRGAVNSNGQIYNGIGEYIELKREDVCDNRSIGCSTGLHVGSEYYGRNWAEKGIIVKVNPKDVVSVPSCESEKCRVCAYKVIGDYVPEDEKLTKAIYREEVAVESEEGNSTDDLDELLDELLDEDKVENEIHEHILNYVRNHDVATLQKISNSMSPHYMPIGDVKDIIENELPQLQIQQADRLGNSVVTFV